MCGISGIYHLNRSLLDLADLKRFTDSMTHRGPDGSGYEILDRGCLGFGQRRLAILDLSELGKQPMSYADGRFMITYNGEIFNFLSIKLELEGLGHVFRSETDTEVILAAYLEWGKNCLNRFNGMWAFAIWDEQQQELFLARDRFGIKPLYYMYEAGKRFAFASETRAFKFLNAYQRRFDDDLLAENMKDPYALEGLGYTIFKGIYQLLPGHYMIVKGEAHIQQRRWWHILENKQNISAGFNEQSEQFYAIFRDACSLRLISDVPVATALSGGLDSTAVYSMVHDILKHGPPGRVNADSQRAFTAVFPGLPDDERIYAEQAVAYTGGNITLLDGSADNLPDRIERETELCDFIHVAPISSISAVYEGMRKNGIVVSLDGHGVDEMLYGYRDMVYGLYNDALWHGRAENCEDYGKVLENMYHSDLTKEMQMRFSEQMKEKRRRDASLITSFKKLFRSEEQITAFMPLPLHSLSDRPYDFSKLPLAERMLYNEFFQHTLPALLRNFDRAGMINSVEIRMPFMDWRLVSFVFSLPVSSKIGMGFTKRILREAMKGHMDETLRTRTFKVGISSPVKTWLNGPLKNWAMDSIDNAALRVLTEKALRSETGMDADMARMVWQNINAKLIR